MSSHLTTLIGRVKRSIKVNRKLSEDQRLAASLSLAFNLAEYMSYNNDFSAEEESEAKRLLNLMGLPHKVDENHGASFYDVMDKLVKEGKIHTIPSRTCLRCGRELTNKVSIQHGMGPVCYAKRVREVSQATAGIEKAEVLEGMNKIAAEPNPDIDQALGIEPENQSTGIKLATTGILLVDPRWNEELAAMKPLPASNPEPKPEPKAKKTIQANLFMYI